MLARSRFVSTGNVNITINQEKKISVPVGGKLLHTLSAEKLFVPSACGGGAGMAPMRSHIFDQLKRLKSKRKINF